MSPSRGPPRYSRTTGRLLRPSIYGVVFLLVAGAGVAFIATTFGVEASEVWQHVRSADAGLFAAAVGVFYLSIAVRGWRWRVIMQNASTSAAASPRIPELSECVQLVLMARFVDSVTWLRLGNMYRAYLVSSVRPARIPHVIGTILSEHILDALTIFAAILAVGAYIAIRGIEIPVVQPVLAGAGTIAVLSAALLTMRRYGVRLARRLPRRFTALYLRLHRGLMAGLRARRMPLLMSLSVLGWFLAVARWYFVTAALGASVTFPLVLFLSITNVLIAAIPITPGGLGLVEPGATAVLAIELPLDIAIASALTERAISYVSVVATGAAVFLGRGVAGRPRAGRS